MTEQSDNTSSTKNEFQYDSPFRTRIGQYDYTVINGQIRKSGPIRKPKMITLRPDERLSTHTMNKELQLDLSKPSKTVEVTENSNQDKK